MATYYLDNNGKVVKKKKEKEGTTYTLNSNGKVVPKAKAPVRYQSKYENNTSQSDKYAQKYAPTRTTRADIDKAKNSNVLNDNEKKWLNEHQYDYWNTNDFKRASEKLALESELANRKQDIDLIRSRGTTAGGMKALYEHLVSTKKLNEQLKEYEDIDASGLTQGKVQSKLAEHIYAKEYKKWDYETQKLYDKVASYSKEADGVKSKREQSNAYLEAYMELQGKLDDLGYSYEEREAILKRAELEKNAEETAYKLQHNLSIADKGGFWTKALLTGDAVMKNTLGAIPGAMDLVRQKLSNETDPFTGEDSLIDWNSQALQMTNLAQGATDHISSDMSGAGKFLYGTGVSMANFLASAALTGGTNASSVILGSSAGLQASQSAKERGGTDNQALAIGAVAATAEMAFESLSLDNLKALKATNANTVLGHVKNITKQMFTEASEEFNTSIANTVSDALIMGDLSEFNTSIQSYIDNGYSEEEAYKLALKDWAVGLALDAAGGAFSGGVMGGGMSAINAIIDLKNKTVYNIEKDMPEVQRAKALNNLTIQPVAFNAKKLEKYNNLDELETAIKSKAEKLIRPVAEDLKVFKSYPNLDIELDVLFSRNSLNESAHNQQTRNKSFAHFEKMLSCMDGLVEGAKAIQIRGDKYKGTIREDRNIKNVYVLLNAFSDGDSIIPVEFVIKELHNTNKLYMAVTLSEIKKADIMDVPPNLIGGETSNQLSEVNVTQLIKFVNSSDSEFLKHIPDELLSKEQIEAKNKALDKENKKIQDLRNSKNHYAISEKNKQLAPVRSDIAPKQDVQLAPVKEQKAERPLAPVRSDIVSMTEQEANERDVMQSDRKFSYDIAPESPFDSKSIEDVGDRKVKAYMYENEEVKPYFQEEAQIMLTELQNSAKGERIVNADVLYETDGEFGIWGTKRETSEQIAYLLDRFSYTYKDIENGLKAIIEDHGAENNAVSKRLEFMIDERLREGYSDFMSGYDVPANQDYINLLTDKQIYTYSDESWDNWLQSLPEPERPLAPIGENVKRVIPPVEQVFSEDKDGQLATFKSEEKIAQIHDTEPKTEAQRNQRKWAIFIANIFDKGIVFEDLSLKTKNRELMGKWNYTLYSEAIAQRLMGNGAEGVKSLNDIRAEVENTGQAKEFYEYMYHKHNVDRMNLSERYEDMENKPVFGESVTSEISQTIVDKYENTKPEFMDYAQDVYNYMNYLRQQLVDNGVISQATAEMWQEMYPHYVPVRRVGETGLNINVPLDTRRTGVFAPIKKATGGSSDILPLFDTIASRTLQTYRATAKNSFGVELKNTLQASGEISTASIDEIISNIETQESLLQKGKDGKLPTFTVFENGEKVTFSITESMYDALKPVSDSSLLSKTFMPLNVASKIQRGLLTEYNPVFLLTNGIKDVQDVLLNSQHPLKTYLKSPEAFAQILARKGFYYNEYMANGGEQNTYFDNESKTFNAEKKGIIKYVSKPFELISWANNLVEMTPRLAEYIASREAGRSVEVSMLDAARVTTNFRAGGDLTKFLNRNGATFLNASVQGVMQQYRNLREAKSNGFKGYVGLATKFIAAGLPAILLNAFLYKDDEEYEELSDYVKQNYYVFKLDDGKFLRFPKGRTVAIIQDAFEQISNVATGNDESDLKSFLELVVSNLAPNNPIEDNILAPVIQVKNNETWYGDDLVPTRLEDLPAEEQYDESTDLLSRWLGEKLKVSPVKINYLLDQYTGGVGDVVLPMLTPEAESGADSFGEFLLAPLKGKFTTDGVFNKQSVSDFYELRDELTTNAKRSDATDEGVLKNKYFETRVKELAEYYSNKRKIQSSDMDKKQKYTEAREIQKQINEATKDALESYDDVNIDGNYATVGDRQYRLNDEGEWQKITDKELEKQKEVTKALNITPAEYWSNKQEYDLMAKDPEKYKVLQEQGISVEDYKENYEETAFIYTDDYSWAADNPEQYTVSKAITDDVAKYKQYASEISNIKADKDKNGNSISGTAKTKKLDYINSLDLDYGQKIILYRSLCGSSKSDKNTYNPKIIEYLISRDDLSYEDKVTILEELDMNVDANGNISW